VRARNSEGYSPFSNEVVILAAQICDAPDMPEVEFVPD